MNVNFINVGRSKASFTRPIPAVTHDCLEKTLHTNNPLRSNNVEFTIDPSGTAGKVIVGGFLVVGTFTISDIQPSRN